MAEKKKPVRLDQSHSSYRDNRSVRRAGERAWERSIQDQDDEMKPAFRVATSKKNKAIIDEHNEILRRKRHAKRMREAGNPPLTLAEKLRNRKAKK